MKNFIILFGIGTALGQVYTPPAPQTQPSGPAQDQIVTTPSSAPQKQDDRSLFGNEIPLMDPNNNQVTFMGAKWDVANNGAVRARFDKYLCEPADNSADAQRYRSIINDIITQTERSVKTDALIQIGKNLRLASSFPGDGDQSRALGNAIILALDSTRAIARRTQENEELKDDAAKLASKRNEWDNNNQVADKMNSKGQVVQKRSKKNLQAIATNMTLEAEIKAIRAENKMANIKDAAFAKVQYQSLLVQLFMQRRFDHVIIGSRAYRFIFADGDSRLRIKEGSDADKAFGDVAGMPPTVASLDSIASTVRVDAEKAIASVRLLLAQNKRGAATARLLEAYATGEFLQPLITFPLEEKQKIYDYWTTRQRLIMSINSRDYDQATKLMNHLKETDTDFDDSAASGYISAQTKASNLALRNAKNALKNGDEAKFNDEIAKAASIWPKNPALTEAEQGLAQFDDKVDEYGQLRKEYRRLLDEKKFRYLLENKRKYMEAIYSDEELLTSLDQIASNIAELDQTIAAAEEYVRKDRTYGAFVAYELLSKKRAEQRFSEDEKLSRALESVTPAAAGLITALKSAQEKEGLGEYGTALAWYLKARAIYPSSDFAEEGINKLTPQLLGATVDR